MAVLDVCRLLSPRERQRLRDDGGMVLLHERDEIEQRLAVLLQFKSQTAPHVQVFLGRLSERIHFTPPGQGIASVRNALISTLV